MTLLSGRSKRRLDVCFAAFVVMTPTMTVAQGLSAPAADGNGSTPAPALRTPVVPDALVSVPADYRLGLGDVISISVRRHPDVSQSLMIPVDGMLRLPRLRDGRPIYAPGKTCAELAAELTVAWSHDFVLRPGQVTVAVVGQRMRRIYVRGIKGAELDLKPNWRISEVIAVIGGVPQPDRITARITNERRPEPITVNLDAALNVPDSPENIPLLEGDTLTLDVPKAIRLLIVGEGPRGQHEIDNRYGLKRALGQLGYSPVGATGSLKDARIYRKLVPGDPNSEEKIIPLDLLKLMKGETPEVPLRDMDLLYIPPTERYVYVFGEVGGPRKQYMPEDRKTYLRDVIANAGGTSGNAKIGEIAILREVNGKTTKRVVDFGKFFKDQDPRYNPEILPQDMVYVPKVGQRIGFGEFFNAAGAYNILRSLIGVR